MSDNQNSRRDFLKTATLGAAGVVIASRASSYGKILGANDRVRVGIVGYSDRCRQALIPSFMMHSKELNFDFVAVSDVWSRRRDEGSESLSKLVGHEIVKRRNNEELYERKSVDAVIMASSLTGTRVSTSSFVSSGPIRQASPVNGCRTRSTRSIGSPDCHGRAASSPTAAITNGTMGVRTLTL